MLTTLTTLLPCVVLGVARGLGEELRSVGGDADAATSELLRIARRHYPHGDKFAKHSCSGAATRLTHMSR